MGNARRVAAPHIRFGEECHPGLKRADNQDSVAHATTSFGELFVISDGVGGYYGGTEASAIVVSGLPRHLAAMAPPALPEAALGEALQRVNAEVFAAGQSGDASRRRMSATVVLALLVRQADGYDAFVANVGDSRAYLVRGGAMSRLSTDHTAVQGMVDAGVLTPEQAKDHPRASTLTRTVGQAPEVEPSLSRVPLQPRDRLLLCSDGLHGYVADEAIQAAMAGLELTPAACARRLLDLALAAGGPDNISVQVIDLAVGGTSPALRPGRIPRAALYASAAIVLASAAGALAYRAWENRPLSASIAAVSPRAGVTRAPAPAPVASRQPRVGGLAPGSGPEMLPYQRLKKRLGTVAEVDPLLNPECARYAGDRNTAYYATLEAARTPPATEADIARRYTLRLLTIGVEHACGRYDLLLLPGHGPARETATARRPIGTEADKVRQIGKEVESHTPFKFEIDKPPE